jgi:hypothetical protein
MGGHPARSLRYRAGFSKKGSFLAGFPAGCSGLVRSLARGSVAVVSFWKEFSQPQAISFTGYGEALDEWELAGGADRDAAEKSS